MVEMLGNQSLNLNLKKTIKIATVYMKKILCLIFLSTFCVSLFAKERRVYYLDCSYSMVKPNNIWEEVCDNLIKAINNIEDETTELYVIPFAIDGNHHTVLNAFIEDATLTGKENLKKQIRKIKPSIKSKTYHSDPIKDFYNNNRVAQDGTTYMFLMTDGQNEEIPDLFLPEIQKWHSKYGKENVYGFYVMLNKLAKNERVISVIERSNHLWQVETADVNINLIYIENGCVFNLRDNNAKYVDIPISGKISHLKLKVELNTSTEYYNITKYEQYSDFLRVFISPNMDLSLIPENLKLYIKVNIDSLEKFDFLLTDNIVVRCENKYVKAINPTFGKGKKIEKLGEVVYHPKFWWSQEKSKELIDTLYLNPSKDAKANNCCVGFEFVDKKGNIIPSTELHIKVNDIPKENNSFSVNCNEECYKLTFNYSPTTKNGKHQGYLKVVSHNLDRCGNEDLSCKSSTNALCWQIKYDKRMNPLAKLVLFIGIILQTLILLWFILIKPIKYPTFKTYKKNVLIEKSNKIILQTKVDFTGARKVIFSNKGNKQSVLNRFFYGKIVTFVNSEFVEPITFTPTRNRKAANTVGKTYTITPNPIPKSGVATIINTQKSIKININ